MTGLIIESPLAEKQLFQAFLPPLCKGLQMTPEEMLTVSVTSEVEVFAGRV